MKEEKEVKKLDFQSPKNPKMSREKAVRHATKREFQNSLADDAQKFNAKKMNSVTKHSYRIAGFAKCTNCPYGAKTNCPYKGMLITPDGEDRCRWEYDESLRLYETYTNDFDLLSSDIEALKILIMGVIKQKRADKYIADVGVTEETYIKGKDGMIKKVKVQNILKKDSYYSERTIREWLQSMALNREKRKVTTSKNSITIKFTE